MNKKLNIIKTLLPLSFLIFSNAFAEDTSISYSINADNYCSGGILVHLSAGGPAPKKLDAGTTNQLLFENIKAGYHQLTIKNFWTAESCKIVLTKGHNQIHVTFRQQDQILFSCKPDCRKIYNSKISN